MKDNQISDLVTELTRLAKEKHNLGSLRINISDAIVPKLQRDQKKIESLTADLEKAIKTLEANGYMDMGGDEWVIP